MPSVEQRILAMLPEFIERWKAMSVETDALKAELENLQTKLGGLTASHSAKRTALQHAADPAEVSALTSIVQTMSKAIDAEMAPEKAAS